MKVKELLKRLEGVNPNAVVVLSRDEEGNGYGALHDISTAYRWDEHEGEIGLSRKELTPEMRQRGYTEDDCMTGGKACVVLWP